MRMSDSLTRTVTCHSCKQRHSDIWELLKHCYSAHGLRICQVALTKGLQQSTKSAFSLNAFCSERLKEIAEKAGEQENKPSGSLEKNLKRLVPSDETDDEHVASAFTATSGALAPPRNSLVSQMAMAMQHQQHQPPTGSSLQSMWMQPSVLSAMQDYYTQLSQYPNLSQLNNTATAALLGLSATVPTQSPGLILLFHAQLNLVEEGRNEKDPHQNLLEMIIELS
ncbi:unnamed protein product [Nippostrongylus brasiliensis]|uniref:C2H2-type domain-containing protein n=1 Tax=Nippostrongylus brasiliensis TaxID=27835 RepID=A0A0N4XG52_NIPBR|nr:unnamed protein product [Nippostrongylus brasiliensis]